MNSLRIGGTPWWTSRQRGTARAGPRLERCVCVHGPTLTTGSRVLQAYSVRAATGAPERAPYPEPAFADFDPHRDPGACRPGSDRLQVGPGTRRGGSGARPRFRRPRAPMARRASQTVKVTARATATSPAPSARSGCARAIQTAPATQPVLGQADQDVRHRLGARVHREPGRRLRRVRRERRPAEQEKRQHLGGRGQLAQRAARQERAADRPDDRVHRVPQRVHDRDLVGQELDEEQHAGHRRARRGPPARRATSTPGRDGPTPAGWRARTRRPRRRARAPRRSPGRARRRRVPRSRSAAYPFSWASS